MEDRTIVRQRTGQFSALTAAIEPDDVGLRGRPRLAAYLEQLPSGLDSFPECQAKASIHRAVHEHCAGPITGLPPRLQALLDSPPPASSYLPQCQTLALVLAMVEAQALPRLQEIEWIRGAATRLFASPMYRILMFAATPRMVVKSAKHRWNAFFRGSTLSSTAEERTGVVRLHAPTGLFNHDLVVIFEDVLYAAINYAKESSAATRLEVQRSEPDRVEYRAHW